MKNDGFYDSVYLTRRQKLRLSLKNISRKIQDELAEVYPPDRSHPYDEYFDLFHQNLNVFLRQNRSYSKLGDDKELFCIYCESTLCELEVECFKDMGVIVFYYHYYYSEFYTRIEIARFPFTQFTQAVNFIKKINYEIQTKLPELLLVLKAVEEKKTNPKSFEIAVTSIKTICSAQKDALMIYSFFSEIEAYVLLSVDGVETFLIEILLSDCTDKMPDLLRLCNSPEEYVSEDKKMTCTKLYKSSKKELLQIFEEHTDIQEKQLDLWFDH